MMFLKIQANKNASVRGGHQPAPTIAFGHDAASARWFPSLESVLMWGYTTRPAPTVTGGGGKASGIEIFDQNSRKKMVQQIEEGTELSEKEMICGNCIFGDHDVDTCEAASPSGIVPMREKHWRDNEAKALLGIAELNARDSTQISITGNDRIVNPATPLDPVRVTVDEAAVLQAFPSGVYRHPMSYGRRAVFPSSDPSPTIRSAVRSMPPTYQPHEGDAVGDPADVASLDSGGVASLQSFNRAFAWDAEYIDAKGKTRKVPNTKKFLVIGNAVPPLLVEHILESLWD